ncbi:MAG: STAS domain-containing protein [Actinomycetota bacterium]|nr:STAS domain-containing protein [Actinomycetota bacterium]
MTTPGATLITVRDHRPHPPHRQSAVAMLGGSDEPPMPVRLVGELDVARAEWVLDLLTGLDRAIVTVDLSGLSFIDAAGLGAFVRARQALALRGQLLELIGAPALVRGVFQLAGLGALLD